MPIGSSGFALLSGQEIGYVEITSNPAVVSTSEAAPTTIVTAGPFTFDGQPVIAEFFTPYVIADTAAAGDAMTIALWEGVNELGRLGQVRSLSTATTNRVPVFARRRFTPTAGAHTYFVAASVTSTTGAPTIQADVGGVGTAFAAYLRFIKA